MRFNRKTPIFIIFVFSLCFPSKSNNYAVLSGTKYGLKQTRGKFGLGAKMVSSEA